MKRQTILAAFAGLGLLVAGCNSGSSSQTGSRMVVSADNARLLDGMGDWRVMLSGIDRDHGRNIEAAAYFDQAMVLCYAFNHDEAIRSFAKCAELVPENPMPWWGIALASGMHINNPVMSAQQTEQAHYALAQAKIRLAGAGLLHKKLVAALDVRYSKLQGSSSLSNDAGYAAAMKAVHAEHPDDADVAALYAESIMNTTPWNYWMVEGKPAAGTEDLRPLLESSLGRWPSHPGLNHLYIHLMESSPTPEVAAGAADRLREMVPGAGHLVHMPSHIDIRLGEWSKAAVANRKAVMADASYLRVAPRPGFYAVYAAHNHHFLGWTCMMQGRLGEALTANDGLVASIPAEVVAAQPEFVDPFFSLEADILKRFGRWEEILVLPKPNGNLVLATAMWHFNRGVALASLKRFGEAELELAKVKELRGKVPGGRVIVVSPAERMFDIAENMLAGEIAFQQGNLTDAIRLLEVAVQAEDSLMYMEPPEWLQPVRHALGAVHLKAGELKKAEEVYRTDLVRWPGNAWSLHGLWQSLEAQGSPEAPAIRKRFEQAWRDADVTITASCKCAEAVAARKE